MSNFRQLWLQYQNSSGLLLLLLLCLLLADFLLRLRVPLNTSGLLSVAAVPSQQLTSVKLAWTEPMQQWFDNSVAQEAGSDPSTEQTVEMNGASQLGALQVRVRAIFIRPNQPAQAIALVESYQQSAQIHQIERYRIGDSLGDYQLMSIEQHQVSFQATDNTADAAPVVIPVFHFNSGNP